MVKKDYLANKFELKIFGEKDLICVPGIEMFFGVYCSGRTGKLYLFHDWILIS
jgi:hypothetical protein